MSLGFAAEALAQYECEGRGAGAALPGVTG